MDSKIKYFAMFAAGAFIGSVATWQILKKKYDKIIDEEVESIREVLLKNKEELEIYKEVNEINRQASEEEAKELERAKTLVKILDYTSYSEPEKEEDKKVIIDTGPYIISPDEFGEEDEYECYSLLYYADGFLADDNDDVVDDIESMVGYESLKHFGENVNDPDAVYVRNENRKCDYEILRSMQNYMDVLNKRGN